MPVTIPTKSRSDLKNNFVRGARPTAAQFAELIDAMANPKDDGLAKTAAGPLTIQSDGTGAASLQKVVEFYKSFTDANPAWTLQLKPAATGNAGLAFFRPGAAAAALFLDENQRVGIKTNTPGFDLDVNGTVRLGGFAANEASAWPNVAWLRNADTGGDWDEGLVKADSGTAENGKSGFGIHFNENRSFGFYTTGWTRVFSILKQRLTTRAGLIFENQPTRWEDGFGTVCDRTGNGGILNDSSTYNALMILGRRRSSPNDTRRMVRLWDVLDVDSGIETGTVTTRGGITSAGSIVCSGGIYATGVLQNGGFDFYLGNADQTSRGNSGSSRALVKDGGATLVLNYAGDFKGGVKYYGTFGPASSATLKKNIATLPEQEAMMLFQSMKPVKYNYKTDEDGRMLRFGFIAEDTPAEISGERRDMIDSMHLLSVLTSVVKQQQDEISALRVLIVNSKGQV